jgi:hypothetical protein
MSVEYYDNQNGGQLEETTPVRVLRPASWASNYDSAAPVENEDILRRIDVQGDSDVDKHNKKVEVVNRDIENSPGAVAPVIQDPDDDYLSKEQKNEMEKKEKKERKKLEKYMKIKQGKYVYYKYISDKEASPDVVVFEYQVKEQINLGESRSIFVKDLQISDKSPIISVEEIPRYYKDHLNKNGPGVAPVVLQANEYAITVGTKYDIYPPVLEKQNIAMFNGVVTSDKLRSMLNESEGNKIKYPIDEKDIVYNGHYVLLTFPGDPSKQVPILINNVDVKVIGIWDRMTGTPKDLFNSITDVAASRKKIISKGIWKGAARIVGMTALSQQKKQEKDGLILNTGQIASELSAVRPEKMETLLVEKFKNRVKFLKELSLDKLNSLVNTIESKSYRENLSSVTAGPARISGGGVSSLNRKKLIETIVSKEFSAEKGGIIAELVAMDSWGGVAARVCGNAAAGALAAYRKGKLDEYKTEKPPAPPESTATPPATPATPPTPEATAPPATPATPPTPEATAPPPTPEATAPPATPATPPTPEATAPESTATPPATPATPPTPEATAPPATPEATAPPESTASPESSKAPEQPERLTEEENKKVMRAVQEALAVIEDFDKKVDIQIKKDEKGVIGAAAQEVTNVVEGAEAAAEAAAAAATAAVDNVGDAAVSAAAEGLAAAAETAAEVAAETAAPLSGYTRSSPLFPDRLLTRDTSDEERATATNAREGIKVESDLVRTNYDRLQEAESKKVKKKINEKRARKQREIEMEKSPPAGGAKSSKKLRKKQRRRSTKKSRKKQRRSTKKSTKKSMKKRRNSKRSLKKSRKKTR